jgi:hypothetical protein
MTRARPSTPIFTFALLALAGSATAQSVTSFDLGHEEWSISGRQTILRSGGNPGANMQGLFTGFVFDVRNKANLALVGDLTRFSSIRLTVDVKVNSITNFVGNQISRELIVELRDNTNANGFPFTSVYFSLGVINSSTPGWVTLSATIPDTGAAALPQGWKGTGGEDPVTFEPILEPGRTFSSVLASVDSIHFTTGVPGFFFTDANYDIQIDNVGFMAESTCYADCDQSTGVGTLDIFDFLCFQNAFVAGDPYACDCDTTTGRGVCDIFDFLCFQNAFVAGCP